jgi:hypothetical protein
MAKKASPDSVRGYFIRVFEENLDWLKLSSNDEIRARFRADWGRDMAKNEEQSMSTVKSTLRSKHNIHGGRRKKRRKGAKAAADRAAMAPKLSLHRLESLEGAIDNCLVSARDLDSPKLKNLIRFLRLARREIVLLTPEE